MYLFMYHDSVIHILYIRVYIGVCYAHILCVYTYVCVPVCYVYARVCAHCVYNNRKSKPMIADKQRAGRGSFFAYFVKNNNNNTLH